MIVRSKFAEGSSSSFEFEEESSSSSEHVDEASSTSSSHGHTKKYDVFLSFRGKDTRQSFTDHLYKALKANINTFLDDEEIETGEELKPELKSAIKASRASVIVLSENYATSTWCLDELVMILEQRKTSNHIVFPIFYHVEPTHVRKLEKSFGNAMTKHKQKMEAETDANKRSDLAQKIDRWKKALTKVADLKGEHVIGSRRETEFIEELVKDIYSRLRISSRTALPLLIGMDNSKKNVTSWLKDASSHTADILTIWGMNGIGKTTLAKYVYGLHSHEFDTSSFIEDISSKCHKEFNGLRDLQKQLCNDISRQSSIHIHDVSVSSYTSQIENAVTCKQVFLVLDNIDHLDQLNALLGNKGFYPGSKIIITTEDAWLTKSCALFKTIVKPKHKKLLLQGLHETASRELLCCHAFMSNYPKEGYEDVSEKLVKYCQGHPMALEVLGKSLYDRSVAYWEGHIRRLEKEKGSPLNNVLRMSLKSLQYDDDRELFKHIACFFVGMDRDVTETIVNACGINTDTAFTNLIDRCLLSIGWNNELVMHQLLQEMGRFEVREESPKKPWKQSRLWCHEESLEVLKDKKGKGNVLGLAIDMRMLKRQKLHERFVLKTDALSRMHRMMLLQLNYVEINGSYEEFPGRLRWLCMHGFPLKSIPSDLLMENLVALDMSYSNIESFGICYNNPQIESTHKLTDTFSKDKILLGSLKILKLSFCEQLHSLGSFEELPALERLIVTNCIVLVEVSESIKACNELVLIDLSYCNKLEKLPTTIGMLKKVKKLLLDGCCLSGSRIEMRDMNSLEMLKANNIGINVITSSSTVLEAIPSNVDFTAISIPKSLVMLSLANNKLSTESFPMDFSWLSMLKELFLDDNPIISLPNCVGSLPKLERLGISNCKMLMSVEHLPHTLRELILFSDYKPSLRKVVFNQEMSPLRVLTEWQSFAPSSFEFEGMVKVQPIVGVEEKLLSSLGWTELDCFNERRVITPNLNRGPEESEIQMYYQFGIFSTVYGGEKMPNWISHRSKGTSISFTIPSSPKKLRGLNFCSVQKLQFPDDEFFYVPMIIISNITKTHTWMYQHYIEKIGVGGVFLILLSHWMFGMNEMETGDEVTITVTEEPGQIRVESGVSFVYDDGKTDEEDVLGYYKSWNHIIGGDLSPFETTKGEYILNTRRFMLHGDEVNSDDRQFVGEDTSFKERNVWFRALS